MEWYGAFGLLVAPVWFYLEILRLLGFDATKKAVVDGAQPPFGGAHVLLTNKQLPDMDMKKIHGAALPQREFEPVWKYLLTAPVP